MTTPRTADVVVIGLGPGGEEVAGSLAEAGLDVVGVERLLVGGECPYWGCIPSKMMVRAAGLLAEGRRIPGMAGSATVQPDWAPVARRIRDEATDCWDDKVAVDRLIARGGRFVRGEGGLDGPAAVVVGDERFEARRGIVIGTGTSPAIPPIDGLAGVDYWTNHQASEAEELPPSLTVLGGGAIGVELAQVFARFGSQVTVIEAGSRLIPMEEPEASGILETVFEREGIAVRTGVSATSVSSGAGTGAVVVGLADGSEVAGTRLLVATGRRAHLGSLGLPSIGVDDQQRFLPVDDHMRVAPGVWALGDVTGKGLFTHMSMYHAKIVIAEILGRPGDVPAADYHATPRVTFTDPEVGAVGITAEAARAAGVKVRVGVAPVPSSARGWIHKAGNDGVIKVVEDADRGVLVGATTCGPAGGEVLGLLALAVHANVAVKTLKSMIYAYPTFHRAIEAALADLS